MSKNQELKAEVVAGIREKWDSSQSIILVDYRGLTVEQDTQLRREMRAAGIEYKVLKNTLIARAIEDLNIEGLAPYLNGPTAVAFGLTDAVAPAKVLSEFIKKTNKMELKCGVMDNKLITPEGVKALAELPSKEELIAKMLGSMNAPATNFVIVLSAMLRKLLYALNAIKDQKEA